MTPPDDTVRPTSDIRNIARVAGQSKTADRRARQQRRKKKKGPADPHDEETDAQVDPHQNPEDDHEVDLLA
ncbi:MAG: hypothetical protein ACYS8X_02780 [Planctomycetota bacterium]|jgi:hypothetical protein